jgi:transcriptional regulator with XRE-family HTH domain
VRLGLVMSTRAGLPLTIVDTHEYSLPSSDGLGERIHTFRLTHGITQRDLADQLGVTQQSVARWEQGSPPRRYMLRALETLLEDSGAIERPVDLADVIGIRPPVAGRVQTRGIEDARKVYVQGCLKLLERGERLPNRVLLLLADELGWGSDDV